jgi:membrane associated rhomboid family serine protease
MAYASSWSDTPFRSTITKWVRWLLIANTVVFVLFFLVPPLRAYANYLALWPNRLLTQPWSVLTYAFMHAGIGHWFFNMLALFFFGPRLEERWGSREFIKYYLVAALGGAVFSFLAWNSGVVGASAAVNGLLMAWAVYWPDEEVMFFGIFPIKIKWLVMIMGFLSILSAMGNAGDGTAHLAHLGGFVAGFLYLKSPWGPRSWGDIPSARGRKQAASKQKAVVPWSPRRSQQAAQQPGQAAAAAAAAAQQQAASGRRPSKAERELLDDVDRILDKISAQGLASLTPEERARLDEVSRRYRTN